MKQAAVILVAVLLLTASFLTGRWSVKSRMKSVTTCDTLTDTVIIRRPVVRDSLTVRTIHVRVPVAVPAAPADTAFAANVPDTVEAVLPVTQRIYADSSYRAYVSGYRPQLDSIEVYPRTVTRSVQQPVRRWSMGVQAGVGITPRGVLPYAGVGVTYRLF